MKVLWLILLLLAIPASAQLPPVPVGSTKLLSPKHKELIGSLGSTMIRASVAPAQPQLRLTWDWVSNGWTNIMFDVFHSTSPAAGSPLTRYDQIPSGFTLLISVTAPPVPVGGLAQEFFIVRARDAVSGVVSNWNQ